MLGIIGGYMLADFKVLLRQELENAMFVASFVIVQITIALNNSFWRLDKSPTLLKSLLWYSAMRFLGSLGLTYIFYTIASNRARKSLFCCCCIPQSTLIITAILLIGLAQRFLEWQPFQTLSRLSYSYFMVHVITIFYRIFSVKEVYAMTNSLMVK